MVSPGKLKELQAHFDRLRPDQQQRVIDFARQLAAPKTPQGTPPEKLLALAGSLPHEEANEIKRIIEEGCERIEPDEW